LRIKVYERPVQLTPVNTGLAGSAGMAEGKGIPMTPEAWKRMRAEAAKIIKMKR